MLAIVRLMPSNFYGCLGMKRATAQIFLKFEQKQRRMDIAQEMLTTFNDDPDLLKKVITSDESQWNRSEESRPIKTRQVRWNVKVLFTVLFDCNGVVHNEFLLQSRTVNKEYYLDIMRRLREASRQKRTE